ncbi:MAG TPA: hypothetical protein VFM05_00715 [Candidatus Saccharimonadales bacterium]|nr:hypothetical protein [Candidatus Saccharimonadales bacterium]
MTITNRKAIATITLAVIALLQCTDLAAEAKTVWGAAAVEQEPFKGNAEGTIIGVLPGPGGITLSGVAEGNATYLGRFTREEQILLDPLTGTFVGTIVFTAANGDRLLCTLTGRFTSLTDATGTYTFTGGTGRFEHATGGADFVVTLPDGVHYTVEFNGTLDK